MPKHENSHFDEYTAQNECKHRILKAYLPAYLTALKHHVDYYHYIDGFAGSGSYGESAPGSPIISYNIFKEKNFLDKTLFSLVEYNKSYYESLRESIDGLHAEQPLFKEPLLLNKKFQDALPEILKFPRESGLLNNSVATFSFLDPCGITGVNFSDIVSILKEKYGEVLLFFNYDAVNRVMGAVEKAETNPQVLIDMFGSEKNVKTLLSCKNHTPAKKASFILRLLSYNLKKQTKAPYFIPFEFKAKNANRTSHYLVHICKNKLGFRLMKDVMWEAGKDETKEYGSLTFLSDELRGKQFELFHDNIERKKNEILQELHTNKKVRHFTKEWVERPDDSFSEKVYKRILIELEIDRKIVVYDKENQLPYPASARRKIKAKTTLGDDYWLRRA